MSGDDYVEAEILHINKVQEDQSQAMVKSVASVGDLFSGLKDGNLYAVQRGVLAILQKIPGIGKRVAKGVKPSDMLEGLLEGYENETVELGRSIKMAKECLETIEPLMNGNRRQIRTAQKGRDTLLQLDETGEETGGILYERRQEYVEIESKLDEIGYNPTDPTLEMTAEMVELTQRRLEVGRRVSGLEAAYARCTARVKFRTEALEEQERTRRGLEQSINAARIQREVIKEKVRTMRSQSVGTATELKLQEAAFGAYNAEKETVDGVNVLTAMAAAARQQLDSIVSNSYQTIIRPDVAAFSNLSTAKLKKGLSNRALTSGPSAAGLLESAYSQLGVSPTSTREEINEAYEQAVDGMPEDSEVFENLTLAYLSITPELDDVLETPSKRAKRQKHRRKKLLGSGAKG